MNRFLRTASTRRLIAVIAGLVVAILAGTAIAVAAAGSGPVPAKTSLARAIRTALTAPPVTAVSGRITFTNHLIDATDLQGNSDPLLSGASGRFWLSGNRLRVELQSTNGDAQLVVNNGSFWIYDPASQTAYEGTIPASLMHPAMKHHAAGQPDKVPSLAEIQRGLNQLAQHLDISGAIPGDVAGRPVYTVRVAPKHDGGLLGAAELAWDSVRGVPLRVAVYAQHDSTPILQLKITDIRYGSVSASDFAISPPSGAKVVKIATPQHSAVAAAGAKAEKAARRAHREVVGVAAVARKVPFTLAAPRSLDGLTRRSVSLLDWAGTPAALVTYGQNLGGVAVIEQVAKAGQSSSSQSSSGGGDNPSGLSLPTVSINGATAQELATPLGTMLQFTRSGVSYTVIGSVPATAAELAARAL